MAVPKKVINFLDKSAIKYDVINHRKVFTAFDKSKTLRVKESLIGKTVLLKLDKNIVITLVSGDRIIDLDKFNKIAAKAMGKEVKKVSIVKDKWIKENIKGIKIGAMPPFGQLWTIPVFIDKSLLEGSKIILNSGDNQHSIKMTPTGLKRSMPEYFEGSFSKKKILKKKE
ncbi:MAG: YbaK/EbsC family protein [Candidatus Nealsonbacteria bacterium]|nr:YbaK/EbsC family protein [Candidatus Nealsonbacteria bacterium]